ncbi:MAG: DUF2194 domain-containing protein [Anaerolineae bacterium]
MRNSVLRFLSTLASMIVLVALGATGFAAVINKVTFQPQPEYAGTPSQRVLLVHDSADGDSRTTYNQVATALNYAKIVHEDMDMARGTPFASLERYTAIVLATETVSRLDEGDALKIKKYVAGGGGLAVFASARHPVLDAVFGISGQQTAGEVAISTGIHFVGDLLPGLEGLRIEAQDIGEFKALDAATLDGVELFASAGDGSHPLVWRQQFGQGRVIYWNNDLPASKAFRGLVVQSVLAVHSGAVMSLANVGLFHVGGFPAPPPTRNMAGESGLSTADFIYQQWFPDMIALTRKYGLNITWLTTFNRNNQTEPPWDFDEWERATIEIEEHEVPFCTYMAHQASRSGHELALQGYNRQPLRLNLWGHSEDNVMAALEAVRQRWQQDSLGPLPVTYVPPDGLYDENGLAALHAACPSIKVIGSRAFGRFEEGGEREFGPEPWSADIFTVPYWTSEYAGGSYTRLLILSELNTFGAWTHYVRLDDVFAPTSNSRWRSTDASQSGMYDQLDGLLGWKEEHYPWLRHLTTARAYPEFLNYFDTDATYTFEKAYQVIITFSNHPTYLLLRLNDGRRLDLNSLVNAQIVSYYEGAGYYQYVLRGLAQEVRLGLLIPTTGL